MFQFSGPSWAALAAAVLALSAHAQQQAAPPAAPAAGTASGVVPSSADRSVLQDYRPFAEQEVGSWREANETVRQIGGWRAYAKEARGSADAAPARSQAGTAASAPTAPAPTAPPAATPGHAGHGTH